MACARKCGGIEREKIAAEVRDAGAKIIRFKGATYYGIALSVTRICEAILKNQRSILTVGSVIDGPYDIHDVALSLPAIVGSEGIEKIFDIQLTDKETEALRASAEKIKATIKEVL